MTKQDQLINTLHYAGMIETLGLKLSEGIPHKEDNCWYIKDGKLHYYYLIYHK